ncbi:MAG TPA: hypothetical protein VMK12_11990 [Anaeromyxobacteraceae bacterium]|nr:hypothetical protein [Anaeromyxobacteraceae bacterium]
MAEVQQEMADGPRRGSGLELRLEEGGTYVDLPQRTFQPGLDLLALAMEVPDVHLPFEVAEGAAQFRHRLCHLEHLELSLREAGASALTGLVALPGSGLASLSLAFRAGFAEGAGTLECGAPFTFKATLLPAGEREVELFIYEPRLYAPAAILSAAVPALLARAGRGLLGTGSASLVADPLSLMLRRLLPPLGWKVPLASSVRLARAEVAQKMVRLRWDRCGAAAAPSDPDFLAMLEGRRAFANAERHLSEGDLEGARDAYLELGDAATVHPFGASRLFGLLAPDGPFQAKALDLARTVLTHRKDFPPALLAQALGYAARGEATLAARAHADLADALLRRGEESGALAAAEACLALGPEANPPAQARAVEIVLSLRRDHLLALRTMGALGEQGGDRDALLHSCRLLAAHAPEPAEKAAAHARLGTLLLSSDPPAARLHLDHAIRLAPPDPASLLALARACEQAGEQVRAVQALDRARELALCQGDRASAAAAVLRAAELWEGAGQPENAFLRCREACELAPSAVAEGLAARLAETLGRDAEAAGHHAAALALLEPEGADALPRREEAHRALARLSLQAGDRERAATHLAALALLAPRDIDALRRLEEVQAALGHQRERRATLDQLVALAEQKDRAVLLAQAARLWEPEAGEARQRWQAVLELADDPLASVPGATALAREALEGVARAARAQGDGAAERGARERLASLAMPGEERARALDGVAEVLEREGDTASALAAAAAARAESASRVRLETELRLASASANLERAASLLAELADVIGTEDPPRSSRTLLERAHILSEAGEEELALASACEAARRDPSSAPAQEAISRLASDPVLSARALLSRAQLARAGGEEDRAERLAKAGQAALSAGLADAGEAALREALALGLGREEAGPAWLALATAAANRKDDPAEMAALRSGLDLLPARARPGALLRLSTLALAAGACAEARRAAEMARTLAPREPAAIEACRAAADAEGDLAVVPDLLAALAALAPERAGGLLLERARRLAALARSEEADRAMAEALAGLPADAALAAEHVALRRGGVGAVNDLPWGEPLEAFARRTEPAQAARALREAALLALEQGDSASALRCARGAFARAPDDLGFCGPLLARLLYRAGSSLEALPLYRRLLEAGLPGAGEEAAELCRELAELADEAGDTSLALNALEGLLAERPHEMAAALRRFELDPDRRRAAQALGEAAERVRATRLRADALSRAAVQWEQLSEPALAATLFARARATAGEDPAAVARVEARRVQCARDRWLTTQEQPTQLLGALLDLAVALEACGDPAEATRCREERIEIAVRHGLTNEALRDLAELELRALVAGDGGASARHARKAALLLLERGDGEGAEAALRRALARAPSDLDGWRALEGAGRAQGEAGALTIAEALLAQAALRPGDAAPRREAARLLRTAGLASEARTHLWALVRADPGDQQSVDALADALAENHWERAELYRLVAAATPGAARATPLRELARALLATGDEVGARAAARAAFDACPSDDAAFQAALRDAARDPGRLDAVLMARATAVPAEAATTHDAARPKAPAAGPPPTSPPPLPEEIEPCAAGPAGWLTPHGPLAAALARVRHAPFDMEALAEVVRIARLEPSETAEGLVLLRMANDIAAFATGQTARGDSPAPLPVAPGARAAVAHPLASSALSRLIELLAPYLEPLFVADLARRDLADVRQVGPHCAPDLLALISEVQRALGSRPCAAFLTQAAGCAMCMENTRPPSLVMGAGFLSALTPSEQRFLVARGLALVDAGWAVVGKFAPRDVAILCELACRFAGASPDCPILAIERAQPFLDALEKVVPEGTRARARTLAQPAERELEGLALEELLAALRQTSSRVALLHGGDLRAGLAALAASEKGLSGMSLAQLLASPDLVDLASCALSESHLALRAAAERSR